MSLLVKVSSFSYLYSGIPSDESGNGGGFVFDCRFLYNPGRNIEFMPLTGNDPPVKKYLDLDKVMQNFLLDSFSIVDSAIEGYLKRNFTDLMVSYGCTGGRHRSVYASERLRDHLQKKYNGKIIIELLHHQLN